MGFEPFYPDNGLFGEGFLPHIRGGSCIHIQSLDHSHSQLSRPLWSGHITFVEYGRPMLLNLVHEREEDLMLGS